MGYIEMIAVAGVLQRHSVRRDGEWRAGVHAAAHRRRRLQARDRALRHGAHVPHGHATPATIDVKNAVLIAKGAGAGRPRRFRRRGGDGRVGADDVPVQLRLLADHVRQRVVDRWAERQALHGRRQRRRRGPDPERHSVRAAQRSARFGHGHQTKAEDNTTNFLQREQLGPRRSDAAAAPASTRG